MITTLEILKEKKACQAGLDYFQTLEKQEWEVMELVEKVHKDKKNFSRRLFEIFKLTGVCKWFYESGRFEPEWNYQNDRLRLRGFFKGFYESGGVWYEMHYKDGKRHGVCKWFYENGAVGLEMNFENHVLISEEEF